MSGRLGSRIASCRKHINSKKENPLIVFLLGVTIIKLTLEDISELTLRSI